jgi:hypothetical protein
MKRGDLLAQLPGFVRLFEAKAARKLRTSKQEAPFSGTINTLGQINLPADFVAFKSLWLPGRNNAPLKAQALEYVLSATVAGKTPTVHCVLQSVVQFDGNSGTVQGIYFQALPSLFTAGSNWLSVLAYDAYLFGALAEAELYTENAEKAAIYTARSDAALMDVMGADQRDRFSGPLVARAR